MGSFQSRGSSMLESLYCGAELLGAVMEDVKTVLIRQRVVWLPKGLYRLSIMKGTLYPT